MLALRNAGVDDIPVIRDIAFKVWPLTYSPIISQQQIEYMLEMMYSPVSLQQQMENQQHHFLICSNDSGPCGFASYSKLSSSEYKLHKLYVLTGVQHKGAGKLMVEEISRRIITQGGSTLSLNVNRQNPAVNFYKKLGFIITNEEDIDIGNGYWMNDFVMEIVVSHK